MGTKNNAAVRKYKIADLKGKKIERYSTAKNMRNEYVIESVAFADKTGIVIETVEGVAFVFNYDQLADLLFNGYTHKTIGGGMMHYNTVTCTVKD